MIKHRFMQLKIVLLIFCGLFVSIQSSAQIGYQISLLDTKTGEPRTNERVNVSVKISDSKGNIICNETQSVTSDAFGVLSLTVGNETTFSNVDWNNLPLSISASVDGILIGSSSVLNVPVAEYAKATGVLTMEMLVGRTISMYEDCSMTFASNGIATFVDPRESYTERCQFEIDGNNVYVYRHDNSGWAFHYSVKNNKFYMIDD